jgi:hypothetical protein
MAAIAKFQGEAMAGYGGVVDDHIRIGAAADNEFATFMGGEAGDHLVIAQNGPIGFGIVLKIDRFILHNLAFFGVLPESAGAAK